MRRAVAGTALLLAAACSPSGVGSGAVGTGGAGGVGGAGGGGALEYQPCSTLVSNSCAEGLTCADVGFAERCVTSCAPTGPDTCGDDRRCVPRDDDPGKGFCALRRESFETCHPPEGLGACGRDATCLSRSLAMADRCVPVCEAGTLGAYDEVGACPALPDELGGSATSCTPITLGDAAGSLCSALAPLGTRCDEASLRCNDTGARFDTATDLEPAGPGQPDVGAPVCLPTAAGGLCLRVCSSDDGATQSPCACPAGESENPDCAGLPDAGLEWTCVGGAGLPAGIWACRPVEDCTADDAACADNTSSGLTACADTPFTGGPARVCAAP